MKNTLIAIAALALGTATAESTYPLVLPQGMKANITTEFVAPSLISKNYVLISPYVSGNVSYEIPNSNVTVTGSLGLATNYPPSKENPLKSNIFTKIQVSGKYGASTPYVSWERSYSHGSNTFRAGVVFGDSVIFYGG